MTAPREDAAREEGGGGLEAALGGASSKLRRRLGVVALNAVLLVVAVAALLAGRQYDEQKKKSLVEMRARVVLASNVFDTYFAGQISLLDTIAASAAVVGSNQAAMRTYFARLETDQATTFTGGIGWIDREGVRRVSSNVRRGPPLSVADRSYFREVVATEAPFVSEGLVTRADNRRVVIMAVPTRDLEGRLTGVLAGALELNPSSTNQRSIDLGFGGLVVLDRSGQELTLASFARPANTTILTQMRKGDGVLTDVRGLDGASGHVVAFANSKAPGWTTVIDRPSSVVFAGARRGLVAELTVIASAALAVLCIIAWALLRTRRQQEAERRQIRHWDELAQSLGDASATAEVSHALGTSLSTAFPKARVIVAVREDDRSDLVISSFGPEGEERLAREDRDLGAVAQLAHDSAGPVTISDSETLHDLLPQAIVEAEPATGSLFALPLLALSGRPTGSVTLLLPDGAPLTGAEEALVRAHAEHASRALARAGRHEREHDVAIALQRSLLPDALPAIEGLDLAGRYNAGGVGLAVGGDWYDAVRRPDGILHLTVGDVAGRGIPAAVLMGQLRNAFRALAYDHSSPVEVARRLTRLVPPDEMATAVFLTIDPYTGELTYASAGHPPSLLLDADKRIVDRLDQASAPPLGWASADDVHEVSVSLPDRGTLLAYTDGLVERRGAGIDEGIDRLAGLLRDAPDLSAAEASDRLLDYLVIPLSATDDIALLLVRHVSVPATMEIEIPADSGLMQGLRARLRAWLTRRGLDEDQQADAVLAVTEACNNAIEHAYAERAGTIRLRLEHCADALAVAIEDDGAWRPPRPDPNRGRGTMIMNATMDHAAITHNGSGTRVELELRLGARDPEGHL